MPKILFVEDEPVLGKLVKEAMLRKHYEVFWATNGFDAITMFREHHPDICVLDVMLPSMDGFTLAKELKSVRPDVPVLFLTARSQTEDVVRGFESGGNDYLKKPFSLEELFLRIGELLKRYQQGVSPSIIQEQDSYRIGRYRFHPASQVLKTEQQTFNLSHKEAELLRELVLHKNAVLERKTVLLKLWGDDNFFNSRNMDVYIARLRKYLVHDPGLSIVNIRGFGYKLIEQEA